MPPKRTKKIVNYMHISPPSSSSSEEAEQEERKPDLPVATGPAPTVPRAPEGAKRIWLRFVGNNPKWGRQAEQEIRALYDRSLSYAFKTYAGNVNESVRYMRFIYDGIRLDSTMSAHHYGMEDGDQIDVFQEQHGGVEEEI